MPVSVRINTVSPVCPRKNLGPCQRYHTVYGFCRSFHGRTQMNKIFLRCVVIRVHSLTDHVLSRINQCLSIENILKRMVLVFTRSLQWLHSTSRFVHGNTSGTIRGEIKHVLPYGPWRRPMLTRFVMNHGGLSQTITDWRSRMIRCLIREGVRGALLADLFLYSYGEEFVQNMLQDKKKMPCPSTIHVHVHVHIDISMS
jgi:hypothetical protein